VQNTVVTLCGSARFEQQFIDANRELTLRGLAVYSLACMPSQNGGKDWYTPGQKAVLDLAHLRKIQLSHVIFVVGDGYIGHSTAREIIWADMLGLPIVPQWKTHSWDNAAHCIKSGTWSTHIVPDAKAALESLS
jgi:hypothetical protein